MNRMLIAVMAIVVLVLAVPSFAAMSELNAQAASVEGRGVGSGALAAGFAAPVPGLAISPGDRTVTGEVVMSFPDTIVIHTRAGLQRFEITKKTVMLAGAGGGEDVTVIYRPAQDSVKVSALDGGDARTGGQVRVANLALAVTPQMAVASTR